MASAPTTTPARGAAPGAATATAELVVETDERMEACWIQTLEAVSQRKKLLAAFLKESRFVGLAGETAVVAMDDLHRAVVDEKENRAIVTEALCAAFGRQLKLHCATLDAAELAAKRPTHESVKPMIDKAIEWFDGDIIERGGRDGERKNG
jgi:hypothetical protein